MGRLSLFLVELAICFLASGVVVLVLTGPLRRILIDACGSLERARFWVVYSDAMIFIAPLVAIVVFGKSSELSAPTLGFYKSALGSALFGRLRRARRHRTSGCPPPAAPLDARRLAGSLRRSIGVRSPAALNRPVSDVLTGSWLLESPVFSS